MDVFGIFLVAMNMAFAFHSVHTGLYWGAGLHLAAALLLVAVMSRVSR